MPFEELLHRGISGNNMIDLGCRPPLLRQVPGISNGEGIRKPSFIRYDMNELCQHLRSERQSMPAFDQRRKELSGRQMLRVFGNFGRDEESRIQS